MITYKKELVEAINRSKNSGLIVQEFIYDKNESLILSIENQIKLNELLHHYVYSKNIEAIANQCFFWNFHLQQAIEELLRCDSILTVGYVDFKNRSAFITSTEEILTWLNVKYDTLQHRNIHVWLTLPTFEIIDITLVSSFLKINNEIFGEKIDFRNCFMFLPEENAGSNIPVHRPQFVGMDFFYKTGISKDYDFDILK